MNWWTRTTKKNNSRHFQEIIEDLVFNCPVSIRTYPKKKNEKQGLKINRISARKCSFYDRGIKGNLLTAILHQIRKPLINNGGYAYVNKDESVEDRVNSIIKNTTCSDKYFDLIVHTKVESITETESIFYAIRNAFAHGSFEIKNEAGITVYYLESKKNDDIRSRMRLKEETLLMYCDLSKMMVSDVKKNKKRSTRR